MMTTVTKDTFDKLVVKGDKPVMLFVHSSTCGPCRMMLPVVKKLASELEGVTVADLWTDTDLDAVRPYNVHVVPTILFFSGGKCVDRLERACTAGAIKEKLNSVVK